MPDGNLPGRDHLATDVRQHIQKEPAPAAARSTCQETGTSCQETGTSCQEKARGEGEASGQKGTGRQKETSRQEGKSSSIAKTGRSSFRREKSCVRLEKPMQRPVWRCQGVDSLRHVGVIFQRRRVVRLDSRVDHQRTFATPVFLADQCPDAVNVCCRVGACKNDPQEALERSCYKLAVVDRDNHWEGIQFLTGRQGIHKLFKVPLDFTCPLAPSRWGVYRNNTRQ